MKSKQLVTAGIISAAIIGAALSLGAASSENPIFEYRVESGISQNALNKLGTDGWELVSVTTLSENGRSYADTAYLKRIKR